MTKFKHNLNHFETSLAEVIHFTVQEKRNIWCSYGVNTKNLCLRVVCSYICIRTKIFPCSACFFTRNIREKRSTKVFEKALGEPLQNVKLQERKTTCMLNSIKIYEFLLFPEPKPCATVLPDLQPYALISFFHCINRVNLPKNNV